MLPLIHVHSPVWANVAGHKGSRVSANQQKTNAAPTLRVLDVVRTIVKRYRTESKRKQTRQYVFSHRSGEGGWILFLATAFIALSASLVETDRCGDQEERSADGNLNTALASLQGRDRAGFSPASLFTRPNGEHLKEFSRYHIGANAVNRT